MYSIYTECLVFLGICKLYLKLYTLSISFIHSTAANKSSLYSEPLT